MDPATALIVAVGGALTVFGAAGLGVAGYLLLRSQGRRIDLNVAACNLYFEKTNQNFIALSAWAAGSDKRVTTLEQVAELRIADDLDRAIEGRA